MVRYFKKSWLFIFFLVLNACSVEQKKPPVNVPMQWQNSISINDNVIFPELAWWKSYHDPQLNLLIQEGLKNNNDVNIAMANLEHAKAELKQVQLNWIPGLSLLTGYSEMPNLGDPGYFWGLFPLYTINVFEQIKQQESAEDQVEASQYAKDSVRLTVIGQISGAYFTLLAQTQALDYYHALLSNNQKLLKMYQTQYQSGLISQDDIDQQASTIKLIQSKIAITEHNIFVSKNALHYLLNQNPGNMRVGNHFNAIDSNTIIPGNLPATVLRNRPDVQKSKAVLKMANANIGVAESQLLPSVRLDVFAGDASYMNNGFFTLNEALTKIPVLKPTVFGQIQASQAVYKAAYIGYIDTIRKALRDVNNDLSAYSTYSRQLENNQLAWKYENQQCQLVNSRYKQGIDSQVEVLQCQIKLNEFLLMLNQNKLEKMMTIVALYQDLGGGYKHGL